MTTVRITRAVAGAFVLVSLALGIGGNPWWFAFTAFVGLNLFQSAFTDWCLLEWILIKLGVPKCAPGDVAASRRDKGAEPPRT